MAHDRTFVVVGAGQAGSWIARTLRAEGFDGRLLLIGDEIHAPYERPPLSKSILSGEATIAAATLLSRDEAAAQSIELWTGYAVTKVDASARAIHLSDGRVQAYDTLFLTTGGRARTFPGHVPNSRLHVLRSIDDALRLKAALAESKRIIVIGGGWIGLEVAATARNQGLDVILLESSSRLCVRSAPPVIADFLERLHRLHGVEIHLNATVTGVDASDGKVHVKIGDQTLTADHLLFGIGMTPAVELAAAAGLRVDDGVVVDASGRTSDRHIFAAGDVTRHPSRLADEHVRLESWSNAQNQAIVVAKAALGQSVTYHETPWMWSDQYDVNLQIVGFPERGIRFMVRGSQGSGPCCWVGLDSDGRIAGACAANAPRDLRLARKALIGDRSLDLNQWADALESDALAATIRPKGTMR